jgi:imidazolonepropionase
VKRAHADGAIVHAGELVVGLDAASPWFGPKMTLERYEDGAVAWLHGEVVEAGPTDELLEEWEPAQVWDARGGLVTAGLVDAHTHLVFGGSRADEFARRLAGASYAEIAKQGGGILSTVRATRASEHDDLLERALATARRMLEGGVTTIEAKSGYELSHDGELGLLEIGNAVGKRLPLTVVGTALSAHVVAPEYAGKRAAYLKEVCAPVAIEAHDRGHAQYVDLFVEQGAFTPDDARWLAKATKQARLGLRLHVDQLEDGDGARLAAELGAASADHLDHARPAGIRALAESGTVAVLLPGASLTLGGPVPPLVALRSSAVPTAIATDYNPGTSTIDSLALVLGLACRLYKMTPDEALVGATEAAARSLGRWGRIGCLRPGADADIALWDAPDAATLAYHLDAHRAKGVWKMGKLVVGGPEAASVVSTEPEPA